MNLGIWRGERSLHRVPRDDRSQQPQDGRSHLPRFWPHQKGLDISNQFPPSREFLKSTHWKISLVTHQSTWTKCQAKSAAALVTKVGDGTVSPFIFPRRNIP